MPARVRKTGRVFALPSEVRDQPIAIKTMVQIQRMSAEPASEYKGFEVSSGFRKKPTLLGMGFCALKC